jgi:hypothetical protein
MNLDYVFTNEFGEQASSDDPRRVYQQKGNTGSNLKLRNEEGLQNSFQRGNFLVPNVKEYGWSNSTNDPFDQQQTINFYIYNRIRCNIRIQQD